MPRFYVASPGFTDDQKNRLSQLENILIGSAYFPFRDGGTFKLTGDKELDKVAAYNMFLDNINALDSCDKMIAVVKDFDKGTAFEIGYMLGRWYDSSFGFNIKFISKALLLIDDEGDEYVDEKYNEELLEIINCSRSWLMVGSPAKGFDLPKHIVIDLERKDFRNYVNMGIAYSLGIAIYTYSKKEVDSNIMTSCISVGHYTGDLSIEQVDEALDSIENDTRNNTDNVNDVIEKMIPSLFEMGSFKVSKNVQ